MPPERAILHVLVLTEVGGISELTEACDWWSYGSLLYELLTGTVSSWTGYRALLGTTEERPSKGFLASQGLNRGCLVLRALLLGWTSFYPPDHQQ